MSKKLSALVLFVVLALSVMVSAAPAPVTVDQLKINGDTLGAYVEEYEVEDELEVKLRLVSPVDVEYVDVTLQLNGYKYGKISDYVRVDRLKENQSKTSDILTLKLPALLESGEYELEVQMAAKGYTTTIETFPIAIERDSHGLMIKDVVFFDSEEVRPGEALYTIVRVLNNGEKEEEGVKVSVSVPGLGLKTSDYIDYVDNDDDDSEVTSTELYLRVPTTAAPGTYDVDVKLEYDNGYESVQKTYELVVLPAVATAVKEEVKTLVSAAIEPQSVQVGSTVVYPITVSNLGNSATTYTVTIETADDWATFKVSPSNLVLLESKEAKTVYLYVTPKADAAEENLFVVSVSGNDEVHQVALQANVEETDSSDESGFRRTLEIGLIVLVVLLVIIGLIVAFTKLASKDDEFDDDEDDDDESTQTYY